MRSIKAVQKVIDSFESLPGIGPKSAARLAYYLLHVPQERLERFASGLARLKLDTKTCKNCFNVGEEELCLICSDGGRDKTTICVVEQPLDLVAIEKADSFRGLYHVLGGAINPLAHIGPDELTIAALIERVKQGEIKEVILATNPTLEGEATAMYIREKIRKIDPENKIKLTRLGRGLPTGAEVEYSDSLTLNRALDSRSEM